MLKGETRKDIKLKCVKVMTDWSLIYLKMLFQQRKLHSIKW